MRERTTAMLTRVAAEARTVLGDDESQLVARVLQRSLQFRDARIPDDRDTRLLHPARTIRILIADAGCRDAAPLAAAALVDSLDPDLIPADAIDPADAATAAAVRLLDAMPGPAGDAMDIVEALVTAPASAAIVALAERLDQVRHVHLRKDQSWQRHLEEVRSAWLPAAARLAPGLAARFARWADASERRLILRGRPDLP